MTVMSCSCSWQSDESRFAGYVNVFIGASTNLKDARAMHVLGKAFRSAAIPFGLLQASPNTITGGDNRSGYRYEHSSIEGFAITRMSGAGYQKSKNPDPHP